MTEEENLMVLSQIFNRIKCEEFKDTKAYLEFKKDVRYKFIGYLNAEVYFALNAGRKIDPEEIKRIAEKAVDDVIEELNKEVSR